ncbi:hypothetical protein GCM10010495_68780 [Kitasatospora herbaricolor]|nr:hypothetical protein GCM10010495_68780 [Kitasatospora herbaricolor]
MGDEAGEWATDLGSGGEDSGGELVARASDQMSRPVRDEGQLARAEMAEKGRQLAAGRAWLEY